MPVTHNLLLILFLAVCISAHAQKETFDVVSYIVPEGWNKQVVDGGVQLYITDRKTGGYAIAIITKSMASTGSANGDFKSQWKSLSVHTVSSLTGPDMEAPVQDDGWEILSGFPLLRGQQRNASPAEIRCSDSARRTTGKQTPLRMPRVLRTNR